MSAEMIKMQADVIDSELKVLEVSVWACETNHMPETARSLRLSMEILRSVSGVIRKETKELEKIDNERSESI